MEDNQQSIEINRNTSIRPVNSLNLSTTESVLTALQASFINGEPGNETTGEPLQVAIEATTSYRDQHRQNMQQVDVFAATQSSPDNESVFSENPDDQEFSEKKNKFWLWVLIWLLVLIVLSQVIFILYSLFAS